MSTIRIEEKFKVLTLDNWTIYEPEEGLFIVTTEDTESYIHDDNFLTITNASGLEKVINIVVDLIEQEKEEVV